VHMALVMKFIQELMQKYPITNDILSPIDKINFY
jgi:hypothetical protein